MYKVMFIDQEGNGDIKDLNYIPKENRVVNVIDGTNKMVLSVTPVSAHLQRIEPTVKGIDFVCIVEDLDSLLDDAMTATKQHFKEKL